MIFNIYIYIHITGALSMTICGSKEEKCASTSWTFTCANSAYSYFISACVSVCMICWPHWSHVSLVNGETSLAESCCHSCLAWTRRGSKSLERLSDTPANGTTTSSTSTHLSQQQPLPETAHSPEYGIRLKGEERRWFGCEGVGRKGKFREQRKGGKQQH